MAKKIKKITTQAPSIDSRLRRKRRQRRCHNDIGRLMASVGAADWADGEVSCSVATARAVLSTLAEYADRLLHRASLQPR